MADVAIGRGKSARQAFGLDDIVLVPSRRVRDRDDVDLSWKIDAYRFDLPVMAVGGSSGTGVLPVVDLEAMIGDGEPDVGALRDALAEAKGDGRVAVSVTPNRATELVPVGVKAEAEVIVIRGDVVSADHVSSEGDSALRTLIRSTDAPVIVGGCVSFSSAKHLMRTGAAGVLIGGGRADLGMDVPLATAIADARAARIRHLDETGVYCHIIAMGVSNGVDAAKAIAIGADAVMVDGDAADYGDALRSTMAVCGYTDVKSFQKAEVVVR